MTRYILAPDLILRLRDELHRYEEQAFLPVYDRLSQAEKECLNNRKELESIRQSLDNACCELNACYADCRQKRSLVYQSRPPESRYFSVQSHPDEEPHTEIRPNPDYDAWVRRLERFDLTLKSMEAETDRLIARRDEAEQALKSCGQYLSSLYNVRNGVDSKRKLFSKRIGRIITALQYTWVPVDELFRMQTDEFMSIARHYDEKIEIDADTLEHYVALVGSVFDEYRKEKARAIGRLQAVYSEWDDDVAQRYLDRFSEDLRTIDSRLHTLDAVLRFLNKELAYVKEYHKEAQFYLSLPIT